MPMLAQVRTYDGDPIALAIVLGVLAIFAVCIFLRNRHHKPEILVPAPAPKVQTVIPKAPGSAGNLKLYNVEPKTAAMLMAIVAEKMEKPLNELRFLSIKEIS